MDVCQHSSKPYKSESASSWRWMLDAVCASRLKNLNTGRLVRTTAAGWVNVTTRTGRVRDCCRMPAQQQPLVV